MDNIKEDMSRTNDVIYKLQEVQEEGRNTEKYFMLLQLLTKASGDYKHILA